MLLLAIACTDDLRDISFVENIAAPTNVSALFNILQDNTGTVTITPSAEGAVNFDIHANGTSVDPVNINQGASLDHIYSEGMYTIKVVAFNMNGDPTEVSKELMVSFKAPQNLVVSLENDAATSKNVRIKATADFAAMYEFHSGETGVAQPVVSGNIGDLIQYQYANPGMYTVKVIAKGGAIETTSYTTDFEVTEILDPTVAAATPVNRIATDVISLFSDAYEDVNVDTWNTSWSEATYAEVQIDGNSVKKYNALNYNGIESTTNPVDASAMEYLHFDVWTPNVTELKFKMVSFLDDGFEGANGDTEAELTFTPTLGEWTAIEIPLSEFTSAGMTSLSDINQYIISGSPSGSSIVFVDNFYFYKAATTFANVADDFEGNGTITSWFGDSCGMDNTFANPYINADNSSATVLEYTDTGGQYANIRFDVSPNFDLSSKNSFSLKVYVASTDVTGNQNNQISLKLQDGSASQPWVLQTEIVKPIVLDTWQVISFDFENDTTAGAANPLSRSDFNRIVLQVNGENNTDNVTAYIDDFAWGNDLFTGPIPKDNFEGAGNITSWFGDSCGIDIAFSNPFSDANNASATVLEYSDTGGQYANIRFDVDENFNMEKHTFSLKVYVSSSDVTGGQPNQISLKLQDGTAGQPWALQTEIIKPIILDTWQIVTFNFATDTTGGATAPLDRSDFNRIVIQMNGENNTDSVKAYIDDITYQ